ncbi:MAG: hypothetical protein ACJ758_06670, partial [Actinomycetota bacterium]
GSRLTSTSPQGLFDSSDLTRTYSFDTRPIAGQVLAWYTAKLTPYGYHPSGGTLTSRNSSHVSQRFEDGNHYLYLEFGLDDRLPPRSGLHGGARASARALRQGVSSMTVSIEDS